MFRRKAMLSLMGAFLMFLTASECRAAGGDGPEAMSMGSMCMVTFGKDMIHINAYQPNKGRDEYCEEFPSAGLTVMVFDLETPRFRDLPIEVRIIRDPKTAIEPNTNLEALTEFDLPAQKYASGTFHFEHDFKKPGDYIGLVTLTNEKGVKETVEYKFTMGVSLTQYVPYLAGMLVILAVGFGYWKHSRPHV